MVGRQDTLGSPSKWTLTRSVDPQVSSGSRCFNKTLANTPAPARAVWYSPAVSNHAKMDEPARGRANFRSRRIHSDFCGGNKGPNVSWFDVGFLVDYAALSPQFFSLNSTSKIDATVFPRLLQASPPHLSPQRKEKKSDEQLRARWGPACLTALGTASTNEPTECRQFCSGQGRPSSTTARDRPK